jgi:hypothetical protein
VVVRIAGILKWFCEDNWNTEVVVRITGILKWL